MSEHRRHAASESYEIGSWSHLVADAVDCPKCGDTLENGDRVVDVTAPHVAPNARETIHFACFDEAEEVAL